MSSSPPPPQLSAHFTNTKHNSFAGEDPFSSPVPSATTTTTTTSANNHSAAFNEKQQNTESKKSINASSTTNANDSVYNNITSANSNIAFCFVFLYIFKDLWLLHKIIILTVFCVVYA